MQQTQRGPVAVFPRPGLVFLPRAVAGGSGDQ